MSHITILGSGTANITPEKAAASLLIRRGDGRLVYDFGRCVATRLSQLELSQDDIQHIFISHFHPDHLTDLYPYLHAASWSQIDRRTQPLNLYGPPGLRAKIHTMLAVFDHDELSRGFQIRVHELSPGPAIIAGQAYTVVNLQHSYGLRFDNSAVAGDSSLNQGLIDFLAGTQVAIFDAGHLTDDEIITLAVASQARTLVCSHQYRPLDEPALQKAAKNRGYHGQLIVAADLMKFALK